MGKCTQIRAGVKWVKFEPIESTGGKCSEQGLQKEDAKVACEA
jgi:hypothetical protein